MHPWLLAFIYVSVVVAFAISQSCAGLPEIDCAAMKKMAQECAAGFDP